VNANISSLVLSEVRTTQQHGRSAVTSGSRDGKARAGRASLVAAAFVAGLAVLLTVPAFRQLQADSFRDLYLGRWIAANGIPHHDIWAIANAGGAWIDQQWLSDLISFRVWTLGGYPALAVMDSVFFALAYAGLAAVMRRLGASLALTIGFASFAMVAGFTLIFIRAQTLALPLFPALLWLCVVDSGRRSVSWRPVLIVPLIALWANMHGSAVLGAALAGGYLSWRVLQMTHDRRRRDAAAYAALAVAAPLAVLATPYGAGVLHYYRSFVGNSAMGAADLEWDPPALLSFPFFQMLAPIVLAAISCLLARWRGSRLSGLLLFSTAVTALAAATAIRNNVWLGMTTSLMLAHTARAWVPTRPESNTFLRMTAAAAVVLSAVGVGRLASQSSSRYETLAPNQAIAATAAYAAAHPGALVLADAVSVSALLWKDPWLAGRVAFDGRIEAYRQQALLGWVAFQAGSGPEVRRLSAAYRLLLVSSRSRALERRLLDLPQASTLARDARGLVVVNRAAAGS
jgi:hypothetical protein